MKILDNAIKEIKTLNPDEILKVNDMIVMLKNKREKKEKNSMRIKSRLRVVEALKNCIADFSSDIINNREDRL